MLNDRIEIMWAQVGLSIAAKEVDRFTRTFNMLDETRVEIARNAIELAKCCLEDEAPEREIMWELRAVTDTARKLQRV